MCVTWLLVELLPQIANGVVKCEKFYSILKTDYMDGEEVECPSVLLIWFANESVPPITMQCNSSLSANSNHKIINLIPTTIEVEVEGYTAIINHKP